MSNSDIEDCYTGNDKKNIKYAYEKYDDNLISCLIKIDYRSLLSYGYHWCYNRPLNNKIVDDLSGIILDNNLNWTLTAVKEKDCDEFYIIDGQHRFEAIKKIIDEDDEMKINKYLYVNIYYINDIDKDYEYIRDLFIKINKITPLYKNNIPNSFIDNLINEMIKDPILSIGISVNPKTHSAHQPMIHKKTLNEYLNISYSIIKDIEINLIINNLKFANNKISIMAFNEIYSDKKEKDKNRKDLNNARKIGFFLGLKDCKCKYKFDSIIRNIKDIKILFKD